MKECERMEWYTVNARKCIEALHTDPKNGLTKQESTKRLAQYGKNKLTEKKKNGVLKKFFSQFADFMVLILLCAAGISFFTAISGDGDFTEPVMILIIVILNAVVGTIQECRAESAIEALKKLSSPHAEVRRGGIWQKIPSEDLVLGDIITVSAGDLVCADARLIDSTSLSAEEASLTGESVPSEKHHEMILPNDTPLAEQSNMIFSSTVITSGHAVAVVTATGMNTKVGRIASLIDNETAPPTPLQKSLSKTGKLLGIAALLICAFIFLLGMFQHQPPLEMFIMSISLAVAAIPEGLPAVVTIVLALGVRKMALHRAIVRHLPAVETLGSTSVICSDKTGTLTQNKMTVKEVTSGIRCVSPHSSVGCSVLSLAALCSNGTVTKKGNGYEAVGSPTEKAILLAAAASDAPKEQLERLCPRIDELPFDSVRKRMLTVHRLSNGSFRIIAKGAPDILLSLCSELEQEHKRSRLTDSVRRSVLSANDRLAHQAMRVIGVAYKDCKILPRKEELEKDLVFCGLIGMTDPPRPQAKQAVQRCRQAGIRPVMITGDSAVTAAAIAAEIGIDLSGTVITGAELDKMDDKTLSQSILKCSIFARVSPEHKVRIVKAFQSRGEIAAMTGDGVNDAPALRCADIGCAMGLSGSDAAKSAAAMILTDDNFSTIVEAVEQGRGIFENIRRTVHFLLSCNIGEILTVLCAFLMRLPSPLLAMQLLWVNLVTDSMPALALGVEPTGEDVMLRPPAKTKNGIFQKGMVKKIVFEGCFIGALSFLAFTIGRVFFDTDSAEPIVGRTMTFAVLSLSQLFHAFNLRSRTSFPKKSRFSPQMISAFLIGFVMQTSVISLPFLNPVFCTAPLTPLQWLIVAVLSLSALFLGVLQKKDSHSLTSSAKTAVTFR